MKIKLVITVPPQAPEYVRQYAKFTVGTPGGEGAFREFVERILNDMGRLSEALKKFQ